MEIRETLIDAIGETPLIRLRNASEATGCEILGKAEFMNPGGSVKDRAAKYMVLDAEQAGRLKPGGIIVEGTAGNTGIGLALVGNALGYRTVITIPETQAEEKMETLRLLGAEVREVPAVPFKNPENYVHVAARLAEELAERHEGNVLYADQWENLANGEGHYRSTGPEIWHQTAGAVDAFCCAIGTGGTISGVGRYLKEQKPGTTIAVTDPYGSCMYNYFRHGKLSSEGDSITEGIGQGRVTANIGAAPVDGAFRVSDEEALEVLFDLLAKEGLCLGGSSGINVAGAMQLARELGPGHTVVTMLCDFGTRYQSKLYNPAFLRKKGLPVPPWLKD